MSVGGFVVDSAWTCRYSCIPESDEMMRTRKRSREREGKVQVLYPIESWSGRWRRCCSQVPFFSLLCSRRTVPRTGIGSIDGGSRSRSRSINMPPLALSLAQLHPGWANGRRRRRHLSRRVRISSSVTAPSVKSRPMHALH